MTLLCQQFCTTRQGAIINSLGQPNIRVSCDNMTSSEIVPYQLDCLWVWDAHKSSWVQRVHSVVLISCTRGLSFRHLMKTNRKAIIFVMKYTKFNTFVIYHYNAFSPIENLRVCQNTSIFLLSCEFKTIEQSINKTRLISANVQLLEIREL